MENYLLSIFIIIIIAVISFLIGLYMRSSKSLSGVDEIFKKLDEESAKWDDRYQPVRELSDALKGGTRRGKLGEVALEILLERARLPKMIVFDRNKRFQDSENKIKEPDFIIHLPDERQLVIDCKFSFDDWEKYNKAIEQGESKKQIELYHKEYIRSVKKMIDDTHERDYSKLPDIKSIDATIIYFPLANVFESFEDQFQDLIEYAQDKNILLSNPTIIIYIISIVRKLWSQEQRNKNNDLVKTYVERIYDQIEGLDSTLKKNIKSLEGVTEDTRKLRKKLREGNNSLVELAKKVIDLIIGTPKKKMDD
jgi:DNA recombination protein RmuC